MCVDRGTISKWERAVYLPSVEMLVKISDEMAKKYDIEFLYRDFRVGFREGQAKARELGLYMQKYCGCIFSEEDRYSKKIKRGND